MFTVKNISLLLIVIGIVLLVTYKTEAFEVVNLANPGSVNEGGVCTGNITTTILGQVVGSYGSTECSGDFKCVDTNGHLVYNGISGVCTKCTNPNTIGSDPAGNFSFAGEKCKK